MLLSGCASDKYKDISYFDGPPHIPTTIQADSHRALTRLAQLLSYLFVPFGIPVHSFISTMVSTRPKNKNTHPAAPVMSKAAKRKAGIETKQRPKWVTKDDTIRELTAHIYALENPSEESFSKEPLVCIAQCDTYCNY